MKRIYTYADFIKAVSNPVYDPSAEHIGCCRIDDEVLYKSLEPFKKAINAFSKMGFKMYYLHSAKKKNKRVGFICLVNSWKEWHQINIALLQPDIYQMRYQSGRNEFQAKQGKYEGIAEEVVRGR